MASIPTKNTFSRIFLTKEEKRKAGDSQWGLFAVTHSFPSNLQLYLLNKLCRKLTYIGKFQMSKSAFCTNLLVFLVIAVASGIDAAWLNFTVEAVCIFSVLLALVFITDFIAVDKVSEPVALVVTELFSIAVFVLSITFVPNSINTVIEKLEYKEERILAIQNSLPVDGDIRIERLSDLNQGKVLMCQIGCTPEHLEDMLMKTRNSLEKAKATQTTLGIDARWFNTIVFFLSNLAVILFAFRKSFKG
ncbi:MAG TPA: hypothetical protein DDY19_04355 [Alteromonas macleodii]|nr:hypothetical protein [Alteromonas macleodii]